jgi:uncharacterized protein (TIGR02646 family)
MMPTRVARQPTDSTLAGCLRRYRRKTTTDSWKAFRSDPHCGARAVELLQRAYGPRCAYCDHAHGRTIDHVLPKSRVAARKFAWANWRPCCGDCNNLKNVRRVVDPMREDPRRFFVFNIVTGEPEIVAVSKARQRRAEATARLLNNQTLNDARRRICSEMLDALRRLVGGAANGRTRIRTLLLCVPETLRLVFRKLCGLQ